MWGHKKSDIVSVLGRDEGYTVNHEGKGLYLTVYLESSLNTDVILF